MLHETVINPSQIVHDKTDDTLVLYIYDKYNCEQSFGIIITTLKCCTVQYINQLFAGFPNKFESKFLVFFVVYSNQINLGKE